MIVGVVIDLAVGLLCAVMGLLVWKKRMLTLLHAYHYQNVKPEDIPAYARQVGIGLILIGAGILITGLFDLAVSPLWWVPLAAGLISGLIVLIRAQKKYNGSVL